MPKKRVTIKDVAEAAGVSTQTVSRVVNNHPDVSAETLQRVQRVVKEIGYAPNILARSLISGRSNTLGIVAFGLEYFGPSRLLTGIERQAAELGYSISLNLMHRPETSEVETLLDNLQARRVDGIIWAVPEIGANRDWAREASLALSVPLIFVNGNPEVTAAELIGIDNAAIGRLATEHLLTIGARRVGIITGPREWWEARQRETGWRQALAARDAQCDDDQVYVGDWSAASGEAGLHELLRRNPVLDGVFASNDQMALGVMHAAHRLGRRVPEDLAVVGADNIPEAAHFWPPLTSVRQRLRDAGAMAVRRLDQILSGEDKAVDGETPRVSLIQPELIVRASSRVPDAASAD